MAMAEKLAMDTRNIVVAAGQNPVPPGRSISLKLRGVETDGSIMIFQETVPAGKKSYFHLHHDSDEVAYVVSGEVTFMIGDEVTVGRRGARRTARRRDMAPAAAPLCRAACRIAGRAPARKPVRCCFSTHQPRQAD